MSKIYHQSLDESKGFSSSSKTNGFRDLTDGHKSNVVAYYGIFPSMLKNHAITIAKQHATVYYWWFLTLLSQALNPLPSATKETLGKICPATRFCLGTLNNT